jgi:integrase
MLATLGLAGFRISELVGLRVAQVDLNRGRFKLADAKTDAGVREVEITLYLRDELLAPPWTGERGGCRSAQQITFRHERGQAARSRPRS